jgi:hypothetical protein
MRDTDCHRTVPPAAPNTVTQHTSPGTLQISRCSCRYLQTQWLMQHGSLPFSCLTIFPVINTQIVLLLCCRAVPLCLLCACVRALVCQDTFPYNFVTQNRPKNDIIFSRIRHSKLATVPSGGVGGRYIGAGSVLP